MRKLGPTAGEELLETVMRRYLPGRRIFESFPAGCDSPLTWTVCLDSAESSFFLADVSLSALCRNHVMHGRVKNYLTCVKYFDENPKVSSKCYTTAEAACEVGISRATLQEWIRQRKITPPKATLRGAVGVRLWSKLDVSRLRQVKQVIYRKGRGRKKPK